jgi:putative ABC transport system permease protein
MRMRPSAMFFRLLLRSLSVRRGRSLTALLAITVAAALTTALMTLYADIGAKLRGDFRGFGANVIVTAKPGNQFSVEDLAALKKDVGADGLVVPYGYAVARTEDGQPVVVVGTNFYSAGTINTSWSVTGWPQQNGEALVGSRVEALFATAEHPSTLAFNGRLIRFSKAGVLKSGGEEDSRVYFSMKDFSEWTGLGPTVAELSVPGSAASVADTMNALRAKPEFAKFDIQPVRQIMEAETRVLGKTRFILWLSVAAITLTIALCVLATLTASVLERRKDYAVMKALGSSQGKVNSIFLGETFALALVGSVIGFAAGCALAMWIGRANFHASVEPHWLVFPHILVGALALALLAAILPLTFLQNLQPAAMLKGD